MTPKEREIRFIKHSEKGIGKGAGLSQDCRLTRVFKPGLRSGQ